MASFAGMLERDRLRVDLSIAESAWQFDVSVQEYRELEAGTKPPTFETWGRICKFYGGRRRSPEERSPELRNRRTGLGGTPRQIEAVYERRLRAMTTA